jgi:hypothetical protein
LGRTIYQPRNRISSTSATIDGGCRDQRPDEDETDLQFVQDNRRRSSEIVVHCIPKAAANRQFAAAGVINLLYQIGCDR